MRYLRKLGGYLWALPGTGLGLVAAGLALVSGGRAKSVRGVLEVHGGFATWFLNRGLPWVGPGAAITLGHVVLGTDRDALERTRDHERVHVRQYERLGSAFIPLYLWYAWTAYRRGDDPYRDNPLEREAFAEAPG